jgi:hypothetical protein
MAVGFAKKESRQFGIDEEHCCSTDHLQKSFRARQNGEFAETID